MRALLLLCVRTWTPWMSLRPGEIRLSFDHPIWILIWFVWSWTELPWFGSLGSMLSALTMLTSSWRASWMASRMRMRRCNCSCWLPSLSSSWSDPLTPRSWFNRCWASPHRWVESLHGTPWCAWLDEWDSGLLKPALVSKLVLCSFHYYLLLSEVYLSMDVIQAIEGAALITSREVNVASLWLIGQRQPWPSWSWLHLLAASVHRPSCCQGSGSGWETSHLRGDWLDWTHTAGWTHLPYLQLGFCLPQATQRLCGRPWGRSCTQGPASQDWIVSYTRISLIAFGTSILLAYSCMLLSCIPSWIWLISKVWVMIYSEDLWLGYTTILQMKVGSYFIPRCSCRTTPEDAAQAEAASPQVPQATVIPGADSLIGDLLDMDLGPPQQSYGQPPPSVPSTGTIDLLGEGLDSLVGLHYLWGLKHRPIYFIYSCSLVPPCHLREAILVSVLQAIWLDWVTSLGWIRWFPTYPLKRYSTISFTSSTSASLLLLPLADLAASKLWQRTWNLWQFCSA